MIPRVYPRTSPNDLSRALEELPRRWRYAIFREVLGLLEDPEFMARWDRVQRGETAEERQARRVRLGRMRAGV